MIYKLVFILSKMFKLTTFWMRTYVICDMMWIDLGIALILTSHLTLNRPWPWNDLDLWPWDGVVLGMILILNLERIFKFDHDLDLEETFTLTFDLEKSLTFDLETILTLTYNIDMTLAFELKFTFKWPWP